MKENSALSNVQQQRQPESTLPTKRDAQVMARIWQRMGEIYGHRWASAWGESSNPDGTLTSAASTWLDGLRDMELEQIGKGFEKMVKNGMEWPPTLPEFVAMCREKPLAPYHRMAEKALPPPEIDMGIVAAEMRKMRAILGSA
jgi:hypothetical protein